MKLAKNNFLDIDSVDFKKAQVVIVSFGFEATTTYGKGTKNGPAAIIKASSQVELFDEELWQETYKKINIFTHSEIKPGRLAIAAKKQISAAISKILAEKKLPITLGGEHSITPFIIEEYKKHFGNFSILQFDAHADLRDGYLGQKYSHAAAMRRCLDSQDINLVQIGVRNISNENDELNFWQKNQCRVKTFWAKDKKQWKIEEILKSLKRKVYLTFDVDTFDSSVMPATGTPEPGGLDWYEISNILKAVAKNKKIIGADFVELAPIKNFFAPDFLVAKLIYKTIGYIFKNQN
jgi:agmatinase